MTVYITKTDGTHDTWENCRVNLQPNFLGVNFHDNSGELLRSFIYPMHEIKQAQFEYDDTEA